jgi:NAD(P)H-quinone oxidoreductase subunit 5
LLGHACLRTLQFIRAPTVLHDYHLLQNALGSHRPPAEKPLLWRGLQTTPQQRERQRVRVWLYRFALERGHLDTLLSDFVVAPFLRLLRQCDRLERRWTDFLAGHTAGKSAPEKFSRDLVEELS